VLGGFAGAGVDLPGDVAAEIVFIDAQDAIAVGDGFQASGEVVVIVDDLAVGVGGGEQAAGLRVVRVQDRGLARIAGDAADAVGAGLADVLVVAAGRLPLLIFRGGVGVDQAATWSSA
jgi:hypothetical protein